MKVSRGVQLPDLLPFQIDSAEPTDPPDSPVALIDLSEHLQGAKKS